MRTCEVNEFLEFAFTSNQDGKVSCPCKRCVNRFPRSREEIYDHLVEHGMLDDYDTWYCHGESISASGLPMSFDANQENDDDNGGDDNVIEMLPYIFGVSSGLHNVNAIHDESVGPSSRANGVEDERVVEPNSGAYSYGTENDNMHSHPDIGMFSRLMGDAKKELYPGYEKYSLLSFFLHLYNIKCRFGWSNKSFDELLKLLKDALPEGETLPSSMNESRKIIERLGLKYKKIDACPNDCILFWKDDANAMECKVCHASRWKEDKDKSEENVLTAKYIYYYNYRGFATLF